jgi:hypothetical protein
MEIKVSMTVTKGKKSVMYFVDGVETKYGREITDHSEGDGRELFHHNECVLRYGNVYRCSFVVEPFTDEDTPVKRLEKLIDRIKKVRLWIKECQEIDASKSGEAIVDILDIDNISQVLIIHK